MSAQKGNILVPILAAIALVAILAAGYFFYQTQQNTGQALGPYTPSPVPTIQDETANWKIYSNQRIDLSFKYPPDAKIIEQGNWATSWQIYSTYSTPGKNREGSEISDGYSFVISSSDAGSIETAAETTQRGTNENCPEGTLTSPVETMVSGYRAITYGVKNCVGDHNMTFVSNGNKVFALTQLYVGPDQEKFKKILDQILSTFKFTE